MNLVGSIATPVMVARTRLVVTLAGVAGLFAILGVAAQAYTGSNALGDECQLQHREPLLSR